MYFHFSLSLQTVHRRFIKLECAISNIGHFHLGKYFVHLRKFCLSSCDNSFFHRGN